MTNGSWMIPSAINTLLMTPSVFSRPIHAYTRSRKDVQNGRMISISSTLRAVADERAMAYAIGYATSRHSSVENAATLTE